MTKIKTSKVNLYFIGGEQKSASKMIRFVLHFLIIFEVDRMQNHMAEFMCQCVPHTIGRRVHIDKKQDWHAVDALAHCIDQVRLEVTGDDDPTVFLDQPGHVGDRTTRKHP